MPGRTSSSTLIDNDNAPLLFRQHTTIEEADNAIDTVQSGKGPRGEGLPIIPTLPAKVRNAIYEAVLLQRERHLALLRTCRYIHMEASSMLWQRPASFPSQARLFSWVERSAPADLRRLRTLTLRLTDVDLSPLIDNSPRRGNIFSAWSLYQQELEKLNVALQSVPGLVDVTIIPCDRNGSQLLNGLYLSFLGMIAVHLPRLKQLTIYDREDVIDKVPSLKQLNKVVFDDSRRGSNGPSHTLPMSRGNRRVDVAEHEDLMPIKLEVCEMSRYKWVG